MRRARCTRPRATSIEPLSRSPLPVRGLGRAHERRRWARRRSSSTKVSRRAKPTATTARWRRASRFCYARRAEGMGRHTWNSSVSENTRALFTKSCRACSMPDASARPCSCTRSGRAMRRWPRESEDVHRSGPSRGGVLGRGAPANRARRTMPARVREPLPRRRLGPPDDLDGPIPPAVDGTRTGRPPLERSEFFDSGHRV